MAIDLVGRFLPGMLIAEDAGLDRPAAQRIALLGSTIPSDSPAVSLLITRELARREVPGPSTAATAPQNKNNVLVPPLIGATVDDATEVLKKPVSK